MHLQGAGSWTNWENDFGAYLALQQPLPVRWRRKAVEVHPPPPECLTPPGRLGPGWTYWPGQRQKCTAALRWWRPLKSPPRCATGGEDETGMVGGGGLDESSRSDPVSQKVLLLQKTFAL